MDKRIKEDLPGLDKQDEVLSVKKAIPFKPWQAAIAVLHDNILGQEPSSLWEKTFSTLADELDEIPIKSTEEERRREPRFLLSLPVTHRVKGHYNPWLRTKSLDVSQNGIRLAVDRPIENGTHIELDMKLPNQKRTIRLNGVVVWGKPSQNEGAGYECGVAFENFRHNFSVKGKLIQFMADRLCKLAMQDAEEMRCRPALTKDDLKEAYRLVYEEYISRQICRENSAKLHYSFYCMVPGSRTFLLEMDQKIVGTISLILDSPSGIPMESLFPEEVAAHRKPGRRIAEVSLLSLDQTVFGRRSFSLTDLKKLTGSFKLFKMMFDYARRVAGVTDLFIAMHPKHKDLYHYLSFETIGPVKDYERAEGKPALPMRLDVGHTVLTLPRELSIQRYFIEEKLPLELLESAFKWKTRDVREFLFEIRNLWDEIKPHQRAYLQSIYPELNA